MLNETSAKSYQTNRTGLIYDPLMLDFYCEWDPQYPEKPDRIKKPFERCQFYNLTDKCISIPGRMCTDEEIERCHTERVNRLMNDCESMTTDQLMDLSTKYDSMYFHQKSNKAARFALGSSIELMDNIMNDKIQNGFAIIRPPGHHAMHDEPNGYCYFNNAAVVARTALQNYGLKRILIVDWDVHHGQGVQYAFYDDPRVLYISLHRYDYGNFWPNLRQGDFDHIGKNSGTGFNINIPLNKIGLGDTEYLAAFQSLILPMAYEFNPELVIISSGYDAAIGCFEFNPEFVIVNGGYDSSIGDEKGKMMVTPACYAHLINSLSCLSNGKLCVLLEGGYCIKSLSEGVALSVRALLGYPTPRIETTKRPDPIFVQTILNLITVLRPYWNCLKHLNSADSIELNDFLENWDKTYRTGVPFYCDNPRPEKFELTGFYPLYSDEENIRLDKEIDDLIKKTDLFVPESRTCVSLKQSDQLLLDSDYLKNFVLFDNQNDNLIDIVTHISNRSATNGVCLLDNEILDKILKAATYSLESFPRIKKILVVNLYNFDNEQAELLNNENILFININGSSETNAKHQINLKFNYEFDDVSYITLFSRVVLPIAYQFNPDLVMIYLNGSRANTSVSLTCFEHVLKLMCALANSNNILCLNSKSDLFLASLKIYQGQSSKPLSHLIPKPEIQVEVKRVIESLKSNWDCFQFNEKIPKENNNQ